MLHDQFRLQRIFSRWRVRPCHGEPARSYFARLVMDSEDFDPEPYARRLGIFGGGDPNARVLESVLALPISDQEKQSLIRWTPPPPKTRGRLPSGRLDLPGLFRLGNRFCPDCVKEAPYHRGWWDLRTMRRCIVHDQLLKSSGKTKMFPYYGNLKGGVETGRLPAGVNDGSFDAYQLQRLGVIEGVAPRPLLDEMPFEAIGYYVDRVGRLLSNPKTTNTPRASLSSHAAGFEALGRDERYLESCLSDWLIANNSAEELRSGTLANYGWGEHIGNFFPGTRHIKLFGQLDTARVRACARHGILPRRFLSRDDVDVPMTVTRATREFGLTPRAFQSLLLKVGGETRHLGRIYIVPDAILEKMQAQMEDACSISEAAAMLGCNQTAAWTLGRVKKLTVLASPLKGQRGLRFFRSEISDLLAQLPKEAPPPDRRMHTLSEFCARTSRKAGDVIRLVLDNEIRCYSEPTGIGAAGLRFPLPRHPRPRRGKPAPLGRQPLPASMIIRAEFTAMTGIPPTGVRHLVSTGILRSEAVCKAPLERTSALEFHERYLNAYRYYAASRIGTKKVDEKLRRLGIARAFAWSDVQAVIVGRADFEKRTGVDTTAVRKEVSSLWQRFEEATLRNCPSFVLPPLPVEGRITIRSSSRKSNFFVEAKDGVLVFRVLLRVNYNLRIWKLYQAADELKGMMPTFKWQRNDLSASGRAVARVPEDLELITTDLGVLARICAYKQPN